MSMQARDAGPMVPPPGFPARRAALQLLDAVLRRGQPLEAALSRATQPLTAVEDRALARAIASETLRWLPDLDAMIDSATRLRLADDAKARMVLRLALAQALAMKTPHHAVVATALPLVEGGPRRLVHGVLGALLRRGVTLPDAPHLPAEIRARWSAAWGQDMIASARAALRDQPPLDLTLRDPAATADWAARLGGESLAAGHVRIPAGANVAELPGFADGAWWVQGLSAAIPARLFGNSKGRPLLDLCAAPGGKTMQLAAAGWAVTAIDGDAARIARVQENLDRTGLSATLVTADVRRWQPPAPAPAILLDAPCSATGIFARHPEVLYRARPQDITAFAARQAQMITRAAEWLTPGGTLVYATCSLEQAEGEAQVAVAQKLGLTVDPIVEPLPPGIVAAREGWLRILPAPGLDGFFVARFRKP